jgi:hypothetical protein
MFRNDLNQKTPDKGPNARKAGDAWTVKKEELVEQIIAD